MMTEQPKTLKTEMEDAASWRVLVGDWTKLPILTELLAIKHGEDKRRIHVISDPPYGTATHSNMMRGSKKSSPGKKTAISFPPVNPGAIVPLLMDVATGWIVLFGELEALGAYKAAAERVHKKAWKRAGVAVRTNPQPQLSGDRPGQAADGLAIMHAPHKGSSEWNCGGHAGAWTLDTNRDPDRFHETEKPLNIMAELVRDFARPGDLIIDPYGGAMTTGIAALLHGCHFVGVELQESYAKRGAMRLEAETRGLTLGAWERGQRSILEPIKGI